MAGKPWARPPKTTMLCRVCLQQKPEGEFSPNRWVSAITRSLCNGCESAKSKNYYYNAGLKQIMEKRRQVRLATVNGIKSQRGCLECGESHPACLDFHHRDPMQKVMSVGVLVARSTPINKLLAEIEKCDVLCSNCHRKVHWQQKRPRRSQQKRVQSKPQPQPELVEVLELRLA